MHPAGSGQKQSPACSPVAGQALAPAFFNILANVLPLAVESHFVQVRIERLTILEMEHTDPSGS